MKIFLSYGHDDNSELVKRIKADLEKPENGGHDVWIDTAEIKFGDDWRRKITDGIQDSDWMLAFLSKHSVRDPGVCRDELAIALGSKGGIVSTVLIEDPAEVEPPVSVSHVQWLDMHDWNTKKAEGDAAFEAWYAEKFAEIRRVLDAPTTQRFAGEIEQLAEKLTPIPYAARVGELLSRGFVGREWLAKEIDDWRLNDTGRRVFCITGEPGIGKSAIAAWLAHANKTEVVAVHFCDYKQPNWSDPGQIIRSLAFQIATRLPDYRKFLIAQVGNLEKQAAAGQQQQLQALLQVAGSQPDGAQLQALLERLTQASSLASMKPAELFDALIANAAYHGIQGGRQRYLIVIDALDEAGAELAEFIAQRADRLPRWLAFLVTSRPGESAILAHLEKLNPRTVQADDPRNRDDLQAYVEDWLTSRGLGKQQQAAIVEPLLAASEGNFLYLTTFRTYVETAGDKGEDALANPTNYPKGLSSLYYSFFQRQFPNAEHYRTWQAPFLRLVAAARRPLPEELAQRILGLDEEIFKTQVLNPLGSLFRRQDGAVEPFHKSLRDWLSDYTHSLGYFVSASDGHRRLGEALWQEFRQKREQLDTLSEYTTSELPQHLLAWTDEELSKLLPETARWENLRPDLVAVAEQKATDRRQGETWWRLILRLDEQLFGLEHPATVESLNNVALLLQSLGNFTVAKSLFQRALATSEKIHGPVHSDTAGILNNLAGLLQDQGSYTEAESLYRRALATAEKILGPEHPNTASSLNNLAGLLQDRGNYTEAESLYRRTLATAEKILGPEHPNTASTLNNLAGLLQDQGNYSEAEPLCRRALTIREKILGQEHSDTASSLHSLARLLQAEGKYSEAEPLFRRALAITEKALGPEHPSTASSMDSLASLLQTEGKYSEAEPLFRRALLRRERVLGPGHPSIASTLNNLALVLQDQGNYTEAEPLFRRALAIVEKALGPEHPNTAASLNNLALVLESQGNYTEAEPLLRRALAIRQRALGPEHPDTIESNRRMAVCLRDMGKLSEAEALFKQVFDDRSRILGEVHPGTLIAQISLGKLYLLAGDEERAHNTLNEGLEKALSALGQDNAVTQAIQAELDSLRQSESNV